MFKEIIELARLAANGGMYDRFFWLESMAPGGVCACQRSAHFPRQ